MNDPDNSISNHLRDNFHESILENLYNDRVFSVRFVDRNYKNNEKYDYRTHVQFEEQCDSCFFSDLNKKQVLQLIEEFQSISELMK